MIDPPRVTAAPEIKTRYISGWMGGVQTALDDGRVPRNALRSATNVELRQDGTVGQRPGTRPYGPQIDRSGDNRWLSKPTELRYTRGGITTDYMIAMHRIGGIGRVAIATGEDEEWTYVDGMEYDGDAWARFYQIDYKVLITNGSDGLSYYDIEEGEIIEFTPLEQPATPTLGERRGLNGNDYTVHYAVTANSTVGETQASSSLTVNVSTDREMWNQDEQSITIEWSEVENAQSYNIYCGIASDGDGSPTLYLIAFGVDTNNRRFTDNGTRGQIIGTPAPEYNSSDGPRATWGAIAGGVVWLGGIPDEPYRIYHGGSYRHEIDFSPAHGGWYEVGHGTKEVPMAVRPFRNGPGEGRVTLFTSSSNGLGKRFYMTPTSLEYGATSITYYQVEEDSGADGTESPDGIIVYDNSLYYPSRDGFKTTGTQPQVQGILSTTRISNTIQPDVSTLRSDSVHKIHGLAYEGSLYWAVPSNSTDNNQIWKMDMEREGAWMRPWHIPAQSIALYNDNSGRTHFLAVVDGQLVELSKTENTSDMGNPFPTAIRLGNTTPYPDKHRWFKALTVEYKLLRPRGRINFAVEALTEDGTEVFRGYKEFGAKGSRGGWSDPLFPWGRPSASKKLRQWSDPTTPPTETSLAVDTIPVEVDEDVQYVVPSLSSTERGVQYDLSEIVITYVDVGVKDLT